jgi:hypothetical protein
VGYKLPENMVDINQHIAEASLSMQLFSKLYISANYEGTFDKGDIYNRIYAQLRIRF